jgi:chromosome partitioning protein
VLIVDLDPQGNASTGLGIDRRKSRSISTYDLLLGERRLGKPRSMTGGAAGVGAPSTLDLLGVELEIASEDRAFGCARRCSATGRAIRVGPETTPTS